MEKLKLLDQVRYTLRSKHYSPRTEKTYVYWIKSYIVFHNKRHPKDMGESELTEYLSHLAAVRHVSPATQSQALSALLFLYKHVLKQDLDWLGEIERSKRTRNAPVVLSRGEVRAVLSRLSGVNWLVANLMYGTGMRLMEALALRVKDTDFDYSQIIIRAGKGNKDRITMLPQRLVEPLKKHLIRVRRIHKRDLEQGYGEAPLPYLLQKKYKHAAKEWNWQHVFPSARRSPDKATGAIHRYHVSPKNWPRDCNRTESV